MARNYGAGVIVKRVLTNEMTGIAAFLPAAMSKAIAESVGEIDRYTEALYKAIGKGAMPADLMRAANLEIATMAQKAVVDGWKNTLHRKSSDYRAGPDPNKDRLSGVLGPVLASPAMIEGTSAKGISFLNLDFLNTAARHWYRVNYGAFGSKVAPAKPQGFPVMVDGHALFTIRDVRKPATQSYLPRLFAFEGEEFVPLIGPAKRAGGGHRAALFTDLGFAKVAEQTGPVYKAMFDKYIDQRGSRTQLRAKGVRIRATNKGVKS